MKRFVLSLDGGGTRGIVTATILARLIRDGLRTADLVAGTSTGGLIALALSIGLGPEAIRSIYRDYSARIFSRSWWRRARSVVGITEEKYSADGLVDVLEELFRDARLACCLCPTLVTSYSLAGAEPRIFKSWIDKDVKLVDVARATTAAPTYFEPTEDGLVDGGVFANNPSVCAYAEARRLWPGDSCGVLSIGTGDQRKPINASAARGWGLAGWASHIADLFMDSGAAAVDYQMRQMLGDNYLRLQPDLRDLDAPMDRCDASYLSHLEELAENYPLPPVGGGWMG